MARKYALGWIKSGHFGGSGVVILAGILHSFRPQILLRLKTSIFGHFLVTFDARALGGIFLWPGNMRWVGSSLGTFGCSGSGILAGILDSFRPFLATFWTVLMLETPRRVSSGNAESSTRQSRRA